MAVPIDMTRIQSALERFTIPPRPKMLIDLQAELEHSDPSIKRISHIINLDVGISGFTLKVVNSPLFALPVKLKSIEHACAFLGLNKTIKLVQSILLRYSLESYEDRFSQRLWDSSIMAANTAASIAEYLGLSETEVDAAYSTGLFHNAGMALIYAQNRDYPAVLSCAYRQDHCSITDYEEQHVSTNHDALGYMIAKSWGLDAGICNVIAFHHSPQEILTSDSLAERNLAAILKLSEHLQRLTSIFSTGVRDYEWEHHGNDVMDLLGLESYQLMEIQDNIKALE